MIQIKDVVDFFKSNNNYTILLHGSPDGDTIGSGYALCRALQAMGKNAEILCCDDIPKRYDYIKRGVNKQQFVPETVVSVDVADIKLIGALKSQYEGKIHFAIDHHPSNTHFADKLFLDGNASATCEIIYELILALGVEVDRDIANSLYTGIATDTGCFQFSNTTYRTHEIAAALMKTGIDAAEINRIMFDTKTRGRIDVERKVLDTIEFFFDNRCAIAVITKEMQVNASHDDLEGITALPRQIEGVRCGITLREKEENRYKISVRTHDPVDASEICARLGGGGHIRAAGCELCGPLHDVKEMLLNSVKLSLGD